MKEIVIDDEVWDTVFESIVAGWMNEQLDKQKDWGCVLLLDEPSSTKSTTEKGQQPTCPLCGSELVRTGRCNLCMGCGWSSCEV